MIGKVSWKTNLPEPTKKPAPIEPPMAIMFRCRGFIDRSRSVTPSAPSGPVIDQHTPVVKSIVLRLWKDFKFKPFLVMKSDSRLLCPWISLPPVMTDPFRPVWVSWCFSERGGDELVSTTL